MNDYSDLIYLIAAIAIYGLLVNNTNRALLLNNQILNDSDVEYGAIAMAQDILEEARWVRYDEINKASLENLYDRELYRDRVTIQEYSSSPECPSSYNCKKIDVEITSNFLRNADGSARPVTMSLIKTNY